MRLLSQRRWRTFPQAGPSKSGECITRLQKYHTQLHVRGVRARGRCKGAVQGGGARGRCKGVVQGGGARGEKAWVFGGYL